MDGKFADRYLMLPFILLRVTEEGREREMREKDREIGFESERRRGGERERERERERVREGEKK